MHAVHWRLLSLCLLTFAIASPARGQCGGQWLNQRDGLILTNGFDAPQVKALHVADLDGAGPQPAMLFVGGEFRTAGGLPAQHVAAWDGASWHSFGGTGPIGAPGTGMPMAVSSLLVYNGQLLAGGGQTAATGSSVYRFQDGVWAQLGTSGPVGTVYAMTEFEGDLIAAGDGIYRWNGQSWTVIAPRGELTIFALSVHDGQLYAAGNGSFPSPSDGGQAATKIGRWDGESWRPVAGNTLTHTVSALVSTPLGLTAGTQPGGIHSVNVLTDINWNRVTPCFQCDYAVNANALTWVNNQLYVAGQLRGNQVGGVGARIIAGQWVIDPNTPRANSFAVAQLHNQVYFGGIGGLYRHAVPTADFNNDGLTNDVDTAAFFACLGGACCPGCLSSDLNADGDYGTDQDIEAFFRMLAGQPC
ncbi:MAG TPA: hypothetical protein VD997_03565 [Phycisphaerales bacterium]|nr:hypothetical protein [Phycisphaerales bacterium]